MWFDFVPEDRFDRLNVLRLKPQIYLWAPYRPNSPTWDADVSKVHIHTTMMVETMHHSGAVSLVSQGSSGPVGSRSLDCANNLGMTHSPFLSHLDDHLLKAREKDMVSMRTILNREDSAWNETGTWGKAFFFKLWNDYVIELFTCRNACAVLWPKWIVQCIELFLQHTFTAIMFVFPSVSISRLTLNWKRLVLLLSGGWNCLDEHPLMLADTPHLLIKNIWWVIGQARRFCLGFCK